MRTETFFPQFSDSFMEKLFHAFFLNENCNDKHLFIKTIYGIV